jgi:hypothetical protein
LPPALLGLLAVPVWWLAGYLPWIVEGLDPTGGSGPVGSSAEGLAGTRLVVPLVTMRLPAIVEYAVLGSVAAGALVLLAAPARRRPAAVLVAVGTLVSAVGLTLLARHQVIAAAGSGFPADPRVLSPLTAVLIASAVVGLALGLVVGLGPSTARGLALSAPAVLAGSWAAALVLARTDTSAYAGLALELAHDARWVTGVALGLALGLIGWRTPLRAVLFVVALALAWTTQAVLPALAWLGGALRPGSALPGSLLDLLDTTWAIVRAALDPGVWPLGPWALAVVLGLVGGFALDRLRAAVRTRPQPAAP